MRLALVISSLGPGGAEKVITTLANYLVSQSNEVELFTLDSELDHRAYPLSTEVRHQPLALAKPARTWLHGLRSNLYRVFVLRNVLRQSRPDAVISFVDRTNVLVLLATIGLHIPVVASERVDPLRYRIPLRWMTLRKILYGRAACLVVQSSNVLSRFPRAIRHRGQVIPNAVLPPDVARKEVVHDRGRRKILALGRLTYQKGFDLLIQAFADVAPRFSEWDLVIWGEGEERPALEQLRERLDLAGRVSLPGLTHQPAHELAAADIFVLSSRFEGFPNALCEAMACGLAVISTNCPSGPSDIVRHEVDGLLVPNEDAEALASAMERLMSDKELRQRLRKRAEEVVDRFSLDSVMAMWEKTLDRVVAR